MGSMHQPTTIGHVENYHRRQFQGVNLEQTNGVGFFLESNRRISFLPEILPVKRRKRI